MKIFRKFSEEYDNTIIVNVKDVDRMNMIEYKQCIDDIWNYILDNDKNKKLKVILKYNKEEYEYILGGFLIQFILWLFNKWSNTPIDETVIFTDCTNIIASNIHEKMENLTQHFSKIFEEKGFEYDQLGFINANIIETFRFISDTYCKKICASISLWDIIQLSHRNEEFRDIIYSKIDDTLPFKDIEDGLKNTYKRFLDIVKTDRRSNLYLFVTTNMYKDIQLSQMFCGIGTRMTFDKSISPHIVQGNFLTGLTKPTDVFLEFIANRQAMIYKYKYVAESGALSITTDKLTLHLNIDHSVKDCKTTHFIELHIDNKDMLRTVHEKYYYDENTESLKIIDANNDMHLIGSVIKMRSSTHCALEEGLVCQTCYGGRSSRLKNTRIGGLTSTEFLNNLSQAAMSVKHSTYTSSIEIENNNIYDFFNIEMNRLLLKQSLDVKEAQLIIPRDYVDDYVNDLKSDKGESDESGDYRAPLDYIKLKLINHNDEEVTHDLYDDSAYIFISDKLIEYRKNKKIFQYSTDEEFCIINLSKIDTTTIDVLEFSLISSEVSLYLNKLKKLIDGGDTTRSYPSIDAILYDGVKIINDSGLKCNIVHLENVCYFLVKSQDKIYRPDFNKKKVEYVIEPKRSAAHASDIVTAIATGYISQLMKNPKTFTVKKRSVFSPLFKINLGGEYAVYDKYIEKSKRK